MMHFIKNKTKKIPPHIWILALILCLAIFLRAYNFSGWLFFGDDQVRDATLSGQAASGLTPWPLLGPNMNHTATKVENFYHLGPIYYYFQIISAKIFGDFPDRMAYPDLFFSILSIPLFYFFLRVYFDKKISLNLVALYSLSYYFIGTSRFAWNTNLIAFFTLLLLFSLHKFLEERENTSWRWVGCLGFALGVGVQLHALTMILFSLTTFLVFLFSMKKSFSFWKKWAAVFLIFVALNAGQLISEIKTNFANTKILLNFSSPSGGAPGNKFELLANNTDCNIEANFFFLSSYGTNAAAYGGNKCSYEFTDAFPKVAAESLAKIIKRESYWTLLLASLAFSAAGYILLLRGNLNEKNSSKKHFLRLLTCYCTAFFLVMLPLSAAGQFSDLRYFTPIFFLPFMFLGLMAKFVAEKFRGKYVFAIVLLFLSLAYSNVAAISTDTAELLGGNRSCSNFPTLGELQPVADYLAAKANGQKNIYLAGDKQLSDVEPLQYLLKIKGLNPLKIYGKNDAAATDNPAFLISCQPMDNYNSLQKIGSIYVYENN